LFKIVIIVNAITVKWFKVLFYGNNSRLSNHGKMPVWLNRKVQECYFYHSFT
jgi:hypothetical protein